MTAIQELKTQKYLSFEFVNGADVVLDMLKRHDLNTIQSALVELDDEFDHEENEAWSVEYSETQGQFHVDEHFKIQRVFCPESLKGGYSLVGVVRTAKEAYELLDKTVLQLGLVDHPESTGYVPTSEDIDWKKRAESAENLLEKLKGMMPDS